MSVIAPLSECNGRFGCHVAVDVRAQQAERVRRIGALTGTSATIRTRRCVDLKDFLDALKIEKPILAGFDWGARTANIFAALWPERPRPWSP
jgi:pimeloyl-ACP methyl ester carboxylesterase